MGELEAVCAICRRSVGRLVKGRCDTCYRYHRRHGTDRTEAQRIRANERALEDELATSTYVHALYERWSRSSSNAASRWNS